MRGQQSSPSEPDVRVGSTTEVQREPQNVGFRGQSGSQFRAVGCLLVAIIGSQRLAARIPNHKKTYFIGCAEWRIEIMFSK